jgi:ribosome biogenesis GTPase
VLESYGWSQALQQQFRIHAAQGLLPARVIVQQRGLYLLATATGEVSAKLSGRFAYEAAAGALPVAGDWVAVWVHPGEAMGTIHHLLPRRGAFTRKAAGAGPAAQIVAANVDVALLVTSLNGDLNLRRIERYLAVAWEGRAAPVVVLTKADLCRKVSERKAEIEAVALGVPVYVVSVLTGEGLEALGACYAPGQTAALLGSSGVGKSSLFNALAGHPLMGVGSTRADDGRGRHTTTHRQLVLLPNGRLMLDTPGMRELGLWNGDRGLATAFADVEALAAACRFPDCAHRGEPDCAVLAALVEGILDAGRLRSYRKLQRELSRCARKDHRGARASARKISRQGREHRARKRCEHPAD